MFDLEKGTTNFRTPIWSGFSGKDCEVLVEFDKKMEIKEVTASVLSSPGAWIFPPKGIEIYCSTNGRDFKKVNSKNFPKVNENSTEELQFLSHSKLYQ